MTQGKNAKLNLGQQQLWAQIIRFFWMFFSYNFIQQSSKIDSKHHPNFLKAVCTYIHIYTCTKTYIHIYSFFFSFFLLSLHRTQAKKCKPTSGIIPLPLPFPLSYLNFVWLESRTHPRWQTWGFGHWIGGKTWDFRSFWCWCWRSFGCLWVGVPWIQLNGGAS